MTSSPIHDVITPVLMTSYDLVQLDMIQLTPFYDLAKFYLKLCHFFELLWTNPLIQGFLTVSTQGDSEA